MLKLFVCILFTQSTGIDMTEAEIDKLITSLDQDGDGEIDYGYVYSTALTTTI